MALVFSGVVGWEREIKGRPAGLRTHIMVALGSAGFTLIALELITSLGTPDHAPIFDGVRIIAAIVGGVGFLGAGAIIQSRGEVKGLTTAASVWLVSAIGVASGAGYYALSTLMVGFALITLVLIKWMQRRWIPNGGDSQDAESSASK
jgi:putative Mg2+ transporter-C (MgtC) family protein